MGQIAEHCNRLAILGGLIGACLGCGETQQPVGILDAGEHRLTVQLGPSLVLSRDGQPLFELAVDGLQLGVVAKVADNRIYNPYRVYVPSPLYDLPADLVWLSPTAASFIQEQAPEGELWLRLTYPEGLSAQLHARVVGADHFVLEWTREWTREWTPQQPERVAFMRVRGHADAQEGFYGLGEWFDEVNHRGKVRPMQLEYDDELESQFNKAHVPVPLLIGTSGWGLFIPSPHAGVFALAWGEADVVEAAFGTAVDSAQGLTMHLYGARAPIDITRHYYDTTGYPKLPARWALGPWIWRDENDDQAQVESDLDNIRDLDLATTGYWIDRPYATAVNSFDFEATQFPDPPAMFQHMQDLGFAAALWHTPYLDEQHPATAALLQHADNQGYYPPETGLSLNKWGRPIDVTNPDAVDWWQEQLAAYIDLGVTGFKLDYAEDVVLGLFETRFPWKFADGSDERTMHKAFPRLYHDMYAALMPEDGGFLLCRAASYGEQTRGLIIWPGDLDANFAHHREKISDGEESYVAVGGLPASLVAGLSLGPSGFPFYGADTGGYRHCPPNKEVFMRWFEQTALSSVMQVGTSCNDVPWELGGENGFDQTLLDSYRRYARLHLRLFPYLWSHARAMQQHGRPLQRPLGLAHPELGIHPNDIYLLGDSLLIAPVVAAGATSKTVTFPVGEWVHWFRGELYQGPSEAQVAAPLGELPLFIKHDGLVPMLRPTIDALLPTDDPTRVDSYATTVGQLHVRAVAKHSGEFALFDGGTLRITTAANQSLLQAVMGDELNEGVVYELMAATLPSSVESEQGALAALSSIDAVSASAGGWIFDAASRTLYVKLATGFGDTTISW